LHDYMNLIGRAHHRDWYGHTYAARPRVLLVPMTDSDRELFE